MRGKPGNEVLNTTVTNTQTLHLFLLHMYSYYSSFIVYLIARYDMTSQMLYCTLPISSIVSNQQVMQVSLCIRVYCSISCTKEHCKMYSKCITQLCTCMYISTVFVVVSMHISLVCTMHSSLCMHAQTSMHAQFHALHTCISSVSKKYTVH